MSSPYEAMRAALRAMRGWPIVDGEDGPAILCPVCGDEDEDDRGWGEDEDVPVCETCHGDPLLDLHPADMWNPYIVGRRRARLGGRA